MLRQQEAVVKDNISHLAGKSIGDSLVNAHAENTKITAALTPVLHALVGEQGKIALEFSGSDASYQQSKALTSAIAASTKKMSQNFNSETIDQLTTTLNEGIQAGESISDLSSRVASVYDTATSYRSDRVARTESQFASNGATLDAYTQNPVVTSMQWFANPGACPYCDELDGTVVGLSESFVSQGDSVDTTDANGDDISYQADYGDVDTPPLHPNCSCTIIPVTEADGSSGVGDNATGQDSVDDTDGQTDPTSSEDDTTTEPGAKKPIADDSIFPSPSGSSEKPTVYRGEGNNVPSHWGTLLGDAFYVARDSGMASQFGDVTELNLPFAEKYILHLDTDEQYETLILEAQKYALANDQDLDIQQALPAYISHLGYKAAEFSTALDPFGGIGVTDPKAIKNLQAQMKAKK